MCLLPGKWKRKLKPDNFPLFSPGEDEKNRNLLGFDWCLGGIMFFSY